MLRTSAQTLWTNITITIMLCTTILHADHQHHARPAVGEQNRFNYILSALKHVRLLLDLDPDGR